MAKIKYSALVSEMRNKLNGSVLSKNRFGNYVRNKVTPVNPQSSFQQSTRAILSSLSQGWRGLTPAQRNGWIALAATLPFTDIFGDTKFLTGQNLFVKLNANLLKIGEAQIAAAPQLEDIPAVLAETLTATQSAGSLTALTVDVNVASLPAGFQLGVYAIPPVSDSINFVKNKFRFIGALSSVTAGAGNILALYTARFGAAAVAGQRINVRVALISETSGQQGIPSEVLDIVA